MKYCPTCETRYDEEILRFCMKDGTPLLEEEEPNFIAMPSEELDKPDYDDSGEETVIRRNQAVPTPPPDLDEPVFTPKEPGSPRIVVPTFQEQHARSRPIPPYQPPPKSNTFLTVVLTVFGTLAVLAIGALGFWVLQGDDGDNSNFNMNAINANLNTNLNTNLGLESNFNFNANVDFSTNSNTNANLRTPTPTTTPTPRPTPAATPTASPTPDDDTATPTRTPVPTPSPIIIRPGQTPPPRMNPVPRMNPSPRLTPSPAMNGGVLNGRAVRLPTPAYPAVARQMRASGEVRVLVSVDERGNVVSARAVSGHPLLRQSAENAARQSKMRSDNTRITGEIVYNFRNN